MIPETGQRHCTIDVPDILPLTSDSLRWLEELSLSCCLRHCPGTEMWKTRENWPEGGAECGEI